MVYIQLSENIKSFDKVRIKELNYYDNADTGADKSIGFKYMVYKKQSTGDKILYDKFVVISDKEFIENVFEKENYQNLTAFDSMCRMLLQYLVRNSIETGTLEVE